MKKALLLLFVIAGIAKQAKAQIITTVAGDTTAGYSGDGGFATNAKLYEPFGVAIDASGNLYIADYINNCIRKVNTVGIISTFAGNGYGAGGSGSYGGDGGPATAAGLYNPTGITFDTFGNLYIADWNNYRIRKVNTAGVISTIAGNGIQGYSGDGGPATNAMLWSATAIAFDAIGNMYIADEVNYRIRKVDTMGIISTIAGNGTWGYSGDGGSATNAELSQLWGVALDALGNLYIADNANNVIRKVNTAGLINTFAGNGFEAGTGSGGYSGDGGQATAAELNHPQSISIDNTGNLYISDAGNNCIRKVNATGIINTIAGNGTAGYSGDGGFANVAELKYPAGVVLDALGNLYIADSYNNVIREVCFSSCGTTGIEQYATNDEQVNIYPNPSNGSFVIEPNSTAKQTMQVYDVNGKMVLSQTINGKTSIDASSLNEGVYNISLLSSEGIVNKRLVIVR